MRLVALISLATLACGGNSVHHLHDAAVDTPLPIDARLLDSGAPGKVTVIVTLEGSAAANVPVYFQNADSSLVGSGEVLTDATGTASAMMVSGGFVTVIEPQPAAPAVMAVENQNISTFSGVVVGDVLHDDVDPLGTTSTLVQMTVGGAADSNPLAASYEIFDSCGGISNTNGSGSNLIPTTVDFFSCTTADLLVVSRDVNGVVLDTLFISGVTVTSDSTFNVTGTYTPAVALAFAFTDTPPEVNDVDIEAQLSVGSSSLFDAGTFAFQNTDGGSGSAALSIPSAGSAVTAALEYETTPTGSVIDEQDVVSWGPLPTGAIDVDLGALRLRDWVTTPMLDVVSAQLQWTVGSAGTVPDYVVGSVRAARGPSIWFWQVAAAGNEDGALVYPTLPTDIFDFNFHDTDTLEVEAVVGASSPGGYDAARPLVFDGFNQITDPTALALGSTTGSAAVQFFGPDFSVVRGTTTGVVADPRHALAARHVRRGRH
jgi:hypothetical protein